MMHKKITFQLVLIAILTLSLIALTELWARPNSVLNRLALLTDVRDYLVREYVEEPDQQKMTEAAVRGMISALNDPYTSYFTYQEQQSLEAQIEGTFFGIGAEVDLHEGRLRIVSPFEDSPAWKSGVLAGDIVLKINGEDTLDMSLDAAVDRLKGEKGTPVTITVRHKSGEQQTMTILRDEIDIQTVRGFTRNDKGAQDYILDHEHAVGYIRISQFNKHTTEQMIAALDQVLNQDKAEALIIDLRFNPGGVLSSAFEISNMFLTEDQRVLSTKGRMSPEVVYSATAEDTIVPTDLPVVILANESSASAAEIVTGALTDNQRALFVGTRTYGKGSVQEVRELNSNLGTLKYTNAYYYLPNGRNIHKREGKDTWGVDPSEGCYVRMTPEAVKDMLVFRRDLSLPHGQATAAEQITSNWLKETAKDPQLAAALDAALGMKQTGEWPQVGESGAEILVLESRRATLEQRRQLLEDTLIEINEKLEEVDKEIAAVTHTQPKDNIAQAEPIKTAVPTDPVAVNTETAE